MSDTPHESGPAEAGPVLRWIEHNNDLGDWCPWSGSPLTRAERAEYAEDEEAVSCVARCHDSRAEYTGPGRA